MKLHLLEDLIQRFLTDQLKSNDTSWYLPHSLVNHFHESWGSTIEPGLKERYDLALQSEITRRWWKRDHYRPKEIMLKLIQADPELATIAFKDLANDSASLDGRLSRFNFYCEELLLLHRKNNQRDIENHHHQDASIISLYLAGWFPDKYTLYTGLDVFQIFCREIGSPEIPVIDDLIRYYKMALIVNKFLIRNPQFEELSKMRTGTNHIIKFLPFQTTYEIIMFSGDKMNSFNR